MVKKHDDTFWTFRLTIVGDECSFHVGGFWIALIGLVVAWWAFA